MSYPEALRFLYDLQSHGVEPGLERIRSILDRIGSPQGRFPAVHIAGTNGKGTTAAMVAKGLQEGGYRAGLYTSPHLIDFCERIQINGKRISEETLVCLTDDIHDTLSIHPDFRYTFFEFTTALAFLYFAQEAVDIVVAEVGLGGRFDATNVLTPLVSVITSIDFDHESYLGETIEKIAFEKAGIIKKGVPVVVGAQRDEARKVIETEGRNKQAPLFFYGTDFKTEGDKPNHYMYHDIYYGAEELSLSCPLRGRHQMENGSLAIAALRTLHGVGLTLSNDAIVRGIKHVHWEGRLEALQEDPLVLLDGAHNPAGARALAAYLAEENARRQGSIRLVLGMMQDKNIHGFLAPLLPLAHEIVFTRPNLPRAANPSALADVARSYGCRVSWFAPVPEAFVYALGQSKQRDLLCISGSLYTVGEAKAYFSGAVVSPLRG